MTDRRWGWSEIDLAAIGGNVRALKSKTSPRTLFMAVVKADGYGHGAAPVARAALGAGAQWLGVATVDEALELRGEHISAPILVFSEPPVEAVGLLLEHDIRSTICTREFAMAAAKVAAKGDRELRYHLKIDTGMNRIGVRAEDAPAFAAGLKDVPGLALEGTYTHLANADIPGDWDTDLQLQRFQRAVDGMKTEGVASGILHAANSPATILWPQAHFNMVRCGIAIYGLHPAASTYEAIELQPAMSVKARATLVKRVSTGDGVSYGLTWRAASPTTIVTLPIGYGDGVHRVLSSRMEVLLGGRRCEQVGRVCMDQLMVEAPRRMDVQRGDEAVLVGVQGTQSIRMDELAELAGTINYELACGFGMRLERVYASL